MGKLQTKFVHFHYFPLHSQVSQYFEYEFHHELMVLTVKIAVEVVEFVGVGFVEVVEPIEYWNFLVHSWLLADEYS